MSFNNVNAVNFQFLLLEFYKKINMTEEELVVVLLIDHLLQDGNTFINAKTLALNCVKYEL